VQNVYIGKCVMRCRCLVHERSTLFRPITIHRLNIFIVAARSLYTLIKWKMNGHITHRSVTHQTSLRNHSDYHRYMPIRYSGCCDTGTGLHDMLHGNNENTRTKYLVHGNFYNNRFTLAQRRRSHIFGRGTCMPLYF